MRWLLFALPHPFTSVRNLNIYLKGCFHILPCPRGNKSNIVKNQTLLKICSMIKLMYSVNALAIRLCCTLWWCHGLHICGISMGFPFQPSWSHREVWRVYWIILQYNSALCVTLCYPHHLLGQLLFALPHQLTSIKSLKRYLFRRVFAWISFASRFNALPRHSATF